MNKKSIIILFLSLVVVAQGAYIGWSIFNKVEPSFGAVNTPEELDLLLEEASGDYILIDLRDKEDFIEGHIDSFFNFPYTDKGEKLLTFLKPYKKNKPILLVCYKGSRSAKAYGQLIRLGYTNLIDFTIGYNKYVELKGDSFKPSTGDCGC